MRIPDELLSAFVAGPTVDTSALDALPTFRELRETIPNESAEKITTLPSFAQTIYRGTSYYTVRFDGPTRHWLAILTALNPTLALFQEHEITSAVENLTSQLGQELDRLFAKYEYKQYGYKKTEMMHHLCKDVFDPAVAHLAADHLQVNIVLISGDGDTRVLSDYIHDKNVVLWSSDAQMGAVMTKDVVRLPVVRTHTRLREIKLRKQLQKLSKDALLKRAESASIASQGKRKDALIDALAMYALDHPD